MVHLEATLRNDMGSRASQKLRKKGLTPVIMGRLPTDQKTLSISTHDLSKIFKTPHYQSRLYKIRLEGKEETVIILDYQLHVVTDTPLHVNFMTVKDNESLTLSIPLDFVNEEKSPGLKRGGVLNIVTHALKIFVPANKIPEKISVDLSGAEGSHSICLGDIKLPEGVEAIGAKDIVIATVVPPKGKD